MRIAFIVHTFFPNWRAGTEVYAKSLARKAIDKGHHASVVCYEPPEESESFEEIRTWDTEWEGIPVHRVSFCKRHRFFHLKDYFNKEVEDHLVRYFSEIRPDIVHVVHAMHLSTASIWAAKRLSLPVVSTATDFWYICPTYQLVRWDESLCGGPRPLTCLACVTGGAPGTWLRNLGAREWLARILSPLLGTLGQAPILHRDWLGSLLWLSQRRSWMKKTVAQIDVLLAPTANTTRLITLNGLQPSHIRTSGFGLENHLRRAAEAPRCASVLRVGYIGTFRRSKGLHVLLEAIRRMASEDVCLEVYGSPGHFPEYDRTVTELAAGLKNVTFHGTFANEKLAEVFAGIDVLAIPSLWHENSPLVLLSAFALKTPVVASNVGSLADLIEHGKNGLLFQMGNSEDLAKQLRKLIEQPELVGHFRASLPDVRTIDENIDELLGIYSQLVQDSRAVHERSVARPGSLPPAALRWGSLFKSFRTLLFGAQFRDGLALLRCELSVPGERELSFDFQWHAGEISPEWVVFIHLVDEQGETQIQGDHRMFPYDQDPWGFITYRLNILIAEQHRGKSYRVRLGVWSPESKTRLPVIRSRGLEMDVQECAVSLGVVKME